MLRYKHSTSKKNRNTSFGPQDGLALSPPRAYPPFCLKICPFNLALPQRRLSFMCVISFGCCSLLEETWDRWALRKGKLVWSLQTGKLRNINTCLTKMQIIAQVPSPVRHNSSGGSWFSVPPTNRSRTEWIFNTEAGNTLPATEEKSMEAAVVSSPQLFWEQLGWLKSSTMLTQWSDATARRNSTTQQHDATARRNSTTQ